MSSHSQPLLQPAAEALVEGASCSSPEQQHQPRQQHDDALSSMPPTAMKELLHTLLRSQHQMLFATNGSRGAVSSSELEPAKTMPDEEQDDNNESYNNQWIPYLDRLGDSRVEYSMDAIPEYDEPQLHEEDQQDRSNLAQEYPDEEKENEQMKMPKNEEEEKEKRNEHRPIHNTKVLVVENQKLSRDFKRMVKEGDFHGAMGIIEYISLRNKKNGVRNEFMPLQLSDILKLFYLVSNETQNAIACQHILLNYIYWDKKIYKRHKENHKLQAAAATAKAAIAAQATDSPEPPQVQVEADGSGIEQEKKEYDPLSLDKYATEYLQLSRLIRSLNPADHSSMRIQKNIHRVAYDVRNHMNRENQEKIMPVLLGAILSQRSSPAGVYAYPLYRYMQTNNFDRLDQGPYLEYLLSQAKFNRRLDLPFHDIFSDMVHRVKHFPKNPNIVLKILEIYYPYTDLRQTNIILEALVCLVRAEKEAGGNPSRHYRLDFTTMEMIAASCAKAGTPDTILLLWELIDLLNMPGQPTQSIYEATAVSFAAAATRSLELDLYSSAFSVFSEMEQRPGYVPSRALVKSLAFKFRKSNFTVRKCFEAMKKALTEGTHPVSIDAVNVVLASCAERAMAHEIRCVMNMLESGTVLESGQPNLVPNQDTYAFAIEGLGKHLCMARDETESFNPKFSLHKSDFKSEYVLSEDEIVQDADSFITRMEKQGITPNHHFVREYVYLLLNFGDLETANAMVLPLLKEQEAQKKKTGPIREELVDSKTIYILTKANAESGNMELAKKLESHGSSVMGYFARKAHLAKLQLQDQKVQSKDRTEGEQSDNREEL